MPRGTSPSRVRLRKTCVYRSRGKVFELMDWQPIETAPKDMTSVWLAYKNSYGKKRFAHAQFIPRYTEENDNDWAEYCEEKDNYYTPEGWYEICENWDDYSAMKICGAEFIGWQPLPKLPK